MTFVLKLLLLIGLFSIVAKAEECGRCDRQDCLQLSHCAFGTTKDACNCCEICAKELGEACVAENDDKAEEDTNGNCGEFLHCSKNRVCECTDEDPVCGSDGKTYESLCVLMQTTKTDEQLSVVQRSPCRIGPVIKTPPKDSKRPVNSILVLDCEAVGYPVPAISWELLKEDGSSVLLPNDDASIAVQVRGGPEKNMVSGWVQIMKVLPENVGIYTCIATNSDGSIKAGAKVSISKDANNKENEVDLEE